MAPTWKEQTALVTGAGSKEGIGFAVARRLHAAGATVAITSTTARIHERARELDPSGTRVTPHVADLTKETEVQRLVEAVLARAGRIDILVNNAGLVDRAGLWQIEEEAWTRMLAVHVTGPFFAARAAGEVMIRQGRGAIINIASMRGIEPGTGPLHYNVSKAAALMLTKCLARDLAPHVRVNAIAPGYTETGFHADRTVAEREQIAARIPLGRFSQPEEIGRAAVYLASDEAAYITGQTLVISGGVVLA